MNVIKADLLPRKPSSSVAAVGLRSLFDVQSDAGPPPLKRSPWQYAKWRAGRRGRRAAQLRLWQRGPADALWREGDSALRPSPPSSFLPPRWQDITEKLAVMALLLRRWRPPVSAPMMDSARMAHSFLLERYVNPPRGSASSRWETILIYESISEASGQTGRRGVRLDLRQPTSEQQWDMWFCCKLTGRGGDQVRTSTREPLRLHSSRQEGPEPAETLQ